MKKFFLSVFILIIFILLQSCSKKYEVIRNVSKFNYSIIDHNYNTKIFYKDFAGKNLLFTMFFLNCPDICPMTANNLRNVYEEAKKKNLKNFNILMLSFDSERDNPDKLKEFSDLTGIDFPNFLLAWAPKATVDSIKNAFKYVAETAGDTAYSPSGEPIYFYVHTDKIYLIDKNGNWIKDYSGSEANIEEIVDDLKILQ